MVTRGQGRDDPTAQNPENEAALPNQGGMRLAVQK